MCKTDKKTRNYIFLCSLTKAEKIKYRKMSLVIDFRGKKPKKRRITSVNFLATQ